MCGLFGQLSWRVTTDDLSNADRGLKRLQHRGPDGEGLWSDAHCILGHRRLSIVDLSPSGAQPMKSSSGRSVIVFNGEVYNHHELRSQQPTPCGGWRGTSDTEVLIERLEAQPETALDGVIGMFAFALWRPAERELLLARDRLGEKPLFYALTSDHRLVFASELPPLLETPGVRRRSSPALLAEYLQQGYLNAPRTPFLDIHVLPPAHRMRARLRDGRVELAIERYWDLAGGERFPRSEADWRDEFCATVQSAARLAMRSDVPVSGLLSGGVDSSVVCLLAARASGGNLRTLTVDQGGASSEVPYAKDVAAHIGAENEVVPLEPVTQDHVDTVALLYPELNGDASALAALAVCRAVRRHAKVVLTGDGGDELGGGYSRYPEVLRRTASAERRPRAVRAAAAFVGARWPSWMRGEHRLASLTPLRHPYAAHVAMYPTRAAPPVLSACPSLVEPVDEALARHSRAPPLLRMMLADAETYIPGDTLLTLDRASMSVGLELRAPLLDYRLFELLRAARDEFIVDARGTKRAFRLAFSQQLPAAVFTRRKAGFSVPLDAWVRGLPLEDLLNPRVPWTELFDRRQLLRLLRGYRLGVNRHAGRVWQLAVLMRWLELWRPTL